MTAATASLVDVELDARRARPHSMMRRLVRLPGFWVSAVLVVIILIMAAAPGLIAPLDPHSGDLSVSRGAPGAAAWAGYDTLGRDVLSRSIYGTRASLLVGLGATAGTLAIGVIAGLAAGYRGGAVDSVLSRFAELFFGIPLLLGGVVVLTSFPHQPGDPEIWALAKVVLALVILGWPPVYRLMRSSVIAVREAEYIQAQRVLGASRSRILWRHILPNSVSPVLVLCTLSLGGFIAAEATLSFLGIGLQPPALSWGIQISESASYFRAAPHMLLVPAAFLSITVLTFVLLGESVRQAMQPGRR